jgi:hypothetical protein
MRAFYQLSPAKALALPATEFFALVYRLPFFPGVIAARVAARAEPVGPASIRDVRKVPSTRTAIMADPELSSVISFGGA